MPSPGLPAKVRSFAGDDFCARAEFLAGAILAAKTDVRVYSHNDADGLCSGAVMASALKRAGKSFHLTPLRDFNNDVVTRMEEEHDDFIVLLDLGSSHLAEMDRLAGRVLVIDHHQMPGTSACKADVLNPHCFGRDGAREVCASTLAFVVALAMDRANWSLLPTAMAGALGDRQDLGGLTGINALLLELGEEEGVVRSRRETNLPDLPLKKAIPSSLDPFYRSFCDLPENAVEELTGMGLDAGRKPSELNAKERTALATFLSTELVKAGVDSDTIKLVRKLRVEDKKGGVESRQLSLLVNACGKMDEPGVGIALAMGDTSHLEAARKMLDAYDGGIRSELVRMCTEGTGDGGWVGHFPARDPRVASEVSSLGMLYVARQDRPLLVSYGEGDKTKYSARGTKRLVDRGLDLASACREAGQAVGGHGGGHKVASGATVPKGREADFLKLASEMVERQIGK